ncbi:hypothetical protein ASZ78_014906 [Callipepla squamata]|uniref:NELL2-interacting cell ontogeny regulator 1 n=1 Tax=Callipepla squamata TaxID=9009 RepID=A0A226MWR6_CALSU|nr:hypothetical protein ASZ78_014906 [Callipepla squamata]
MGRPLESLTQAMALPSAWSVMRVAIPFISVLGLLSVRLVGASQDSGSVIPAESRYCRAALMPRCTHPALCPPLTTQTAAGRPCVDCHAFEFMQRALQDLKKMAYNLDTRVCASIEKLSLAFVSKRPVLSFFFFLQTETLLLRAEKRGLCDCFPAMH